MKLVTSVLAVGACAAFVFGTAGFTQETKPAGTTATTKAAVETKKEEDKPKGRLPNNFAKLELTTAQRTRIYAIQADYEPKIDELAEQIKDAIASHS